jgi:hypothetical protein
MNIGKPSGEFIHGDEPGAKLKAKGEIRLFGTTELANQSARREAWKDADA